MEVQRRLNDIKDPDFLSIIPKVAAYSMHCNNGNIEALYALYRNIEYVVKHKVPGAIVECGVWRGGMMMLAALALQHFGDTSRELWLYDTFHGLPKPDPEKDEEAVCRTWEYWNQQGMAWGYGGDKQAVRDNMYSTGYPIERMVFIEGMVEERLPEWAPQQIAVLRLDTDLYHSTYHELMHLYPILFHGGVLVLDDYGCYQGACDAADRYFAENNTKIMLTRIGGMAYEGIKQ